MTQKKKRILAITVIAVFVLGALWYTRPQPLANFLPEEDVTAVTVSIRRVGMGLGENDEMRQKGISLGDPEFEETMAILKDLRFRRSLFKDAIHQANDLIGYGSRSKEVHGGEYDSTISFFTGPNYDFAIHLDFWFDEWEIGFPTSDGPDFHAAYLVGGQEASVALHDALWEILPEESP